jgi:DNA-binding CsgD family transcriptional regulator
VRSDYTWQVDGPVAALPLARSAADLVRLLRLPQLAYSAESMVELLEAITRIVAGEVPAAGFLEPRVGPEPDRTIGVLLAQALRVVAALTDHDLPRAAVELRALVRPLLDGEAALPPLAYLGASVLLDAAVGEPGTDARTYAATQNPANRGAFAWADAIACGRGGRRDEAAALLAEGDAALAVQPWWRRLLHPVVLERAVVDGWGDPVTLLRADLAAHEHAGEVLLARTCRDLLRRAGAPSPRRRGGQAVPLPLRALGVTAREAEVLGLVAQGMTNAQVARRLFLSPRTVDTHVANLLAKTGVGTRAELRSFAEVTP